MLNARTSCVFLTRSVLVSLTLFILHMTREIGVTGAVGCGNGSGPSGDDVSEPGRRGGLPGRRIDIRYVPADSRRPPGHRHQGGGHQVYTCQHHQPLLFQPGWSREFHGHIVDAVFLI